MAAKQHGRYRTVHIKVWDDDWFQSLTPIQPSGQGLFLYLLTARETCAIPGLIRVGEAALCESLKWPMKGFRDAFREVLGEGSKVLYDSTARLIWIPNAIRYNAPASANVVKSWGVHWAELPDCSLKVKAWQHVKAFLEGFGKGFAEAFVETCPAPRATPSPIQEQEKEQEQDQEHEQDSAAKPLSSASAAAPFDRWWSVVPKKVGKHAAEKAYTKAVKFLRSRPIEAGPGADDPHAYLLDRMTAFSTTPKARGKYCPNPATWLGEGRYDDDPRTWQRGDDSRDPKGVFDAAQQFLMSEARHGN